MRISGTEPSSVILAQTKYFTNGWKLIPKSAEIQSEAKRDGVLNPKNYNFNQF